jgi:hypothetical protein
VNQTHDALVRLFFSFDSFEALFRNGCFKRFYDLNATYHVNQDTKEWLKSNGIEYLKLTLKDVLDKGNVTRFISEICLKHLSLKGFLLRPTADKTGKAIQHITFDDITINEFEFKLNM